MKVNFIYIGFVCLWIDACCDNIDEVGMIYATCHIAYVLRERCHAGGTSAEESMSYFHSIAQLCQLWEN